MLFKLELPKLYSRNKDGSIQVWRIEVEGNKYRTIVGKEGGAEIISKWSVCTGKNAGKANETSDNAQAELEAVAKYKKKLKSGGYWENISEVDKVRFVEPMLAHPLRTDRQDHTANVIYPCMVDNKYNGGRVISTIEGCWTRKGEQYEVIPHIQNAIKPLFEVFPSLVIDGEAYNHALRYKLNELMSIIRTHSESSITSELIAKSESIVRYYVYDGYGFTTPNGTIINENTPCIERREALKVLLKDIPYVVVVPYKIANNLDEVYAIYDICVEDGYEGAIIRNAKSPYQHFRTSDLLKVKPVDDAEFTSVAFEDPGSGNWGGTAKIIWFVDKNGNKFKGTFKGNMEVGRKLLQEQDKWIGREVSVEFNGYTGKGIPNYARMNPENCFKNDR